MSDTRHCVEALAREDAHGGVEDLPALLGRVLGVARGHQRVGLRRGARPARAARARIASWALEVEVGDDDPLGVGRAGQDDAPRVDDQRAPARPQAGRVLADLVGGDDEGLVLDRAGAHEHLPVVAGGRHGEGAGQGEDARAAQGQHAEELGEAQVVADGSARAGAPALGERRARRRAPRARSRGRRVRRPRRRTGGPCGRPRGPRRPGRRARDVLRSFSSPGTRSAIEPATRSMPSSRAIAARPRQRRPVEGSAPARRSSARPSTDHFSGSTTSSAPRGRGPAHEAIGRLEVAGRVGGGVELDGGGAQRRSSLVLTRSSQSVGGEDSPVPPARCPPRATGHRPPRRRRATRAMPLRAAAARSSAGATSASTAPS